MTNSPWTFDLLVIAKIFFQKTSAEDETEEESTAKDETEEADDEEEVDTKIAELQVSLIISITNFEQTSK